jgi:hypothetical protein
MDHEIDNEKPSSTEGGEMKVGDKVWVLCEVVKVYGDRAALYMDVRHDGAVFEAKRSDCRPVEPANSPKILDGSIESMRAGSDSVNEPPVKEPASKKYREPTLADLANGPIDCEVRDYHDEPWKSGFLICVHNSRAWRFQAQPRTRNYVYAPHWNQCRIAVPVEPIPEPVIKEHLATKPSPPKILDSSSEPINASHYKQFVLVTDNDGNQTLYVDGVLHNGDNTVYGCDVADAANGCAIKIELRDVDLIVDDWPLRLNDFGVEAKQPESSPLTPSPCMDGVDADRFVDGIMETRGRTSDPINPSHYKQGGIECIEAIKAALGEGFPDYLRGNVMKYLWRYKEKGGVDDLKKSAWYLDRLIKEVSE